VAVRRFVPLVVAAAALALLAPAEPAWAAADSPAPVAYRPPVDATPVIDTFRPPATPYGAGNRGIDYATTPGQTVAAAADGEVVFSGRIGADEHHVAVLHADGLRTSYSFLATTTVRRGDRIRQGEAVGTTHPDNPLHFGVRAGEAYLDPLVLLGQNDGDERGRHRPYLVADPDEHRPLAEVEERRRLLDTIKDAAASRLHDLRRRATDLVRQKADLAKVLLDTGIDLSVPLPLHLALAAARWTETTCTPAEQPPPLPAGHDKPRIAILVGGLGSATGHTAVLHVDTATLGYDEADVHQFTYHPDGRSPYTAEHTFGDIGAAGARLAARIEELQRQHPDADIDVIAHSQGGLVARSAITTHGARPATVVTLGTPHQGADLATAGAALDGTTSGRLLTSALRTTTGKDVAATSIRQMSEASEFLRHLPERGWDAATTHVVSVAARGDPIVPNHQSRLDPTSGAHSVVVEADQRSGIADHSALPGSPEATTEIARALARQPPTCRTLGEAVLDELTGRQNAHHQDLAGAALAAAGLYVDARTGTGALGEVAPRG
jgi:murein DD-endopeptidase MepM/ murein hydrolase activator NlpD/pimeloyl-ACP methyl ester carboxylesterase